MTEKASTPEKTRGRPRAAGLDEAILDAAIRIMSRDGFEKMTFDAIVTEVGTTRPTIYRRFKTKAELAVAAIAHIRGAFPIVETGDIRSDLIAHLNAFQDRVSQPFAITMLGTVLAEEFHHPDLLALYRKHMVAPRRERVRACLTRGIESGALPPSSEPLIEDAVTMMIGSYYAHYVAGGDPKEGWAERVVDVILDGLTKTSPVVSTIVDPKCAAREIKDRSRKKIGV